MTQKKKQATISATTSPRKAGVIIRRVYKNKEHIIVERDGLPVLVLLSVHEYEALLQGDTSPKTSAN